MGAVLAKFLVRILTYLLGLVVVLVLVGMGAFVIARPQIDEFVAAEVKKRGLEISGWDLGLNGRANLRDARMNLPEGVELKATLISARPPVAGIPGAATLYDLRLERGDISLTIPQLDIGAISQYEKDPNLSNKLLQTLHQFALGQVTAAGMSFDLGKDQGTIKLDDFVLENIARGKIDRLTLTGIDGQLESTNQTGEEQVRLANLAVHNIDIEAALSYLTGQLSNHDSMSFPIVGQVELSDLNFTGKLNAKPVTLKLGRLSSQGLALTPSDTVPLDSVRSFLVARREGASPSEQAGTQQKLLSLLSNLNGVDLSVDNLEFGIPAAKIEWQSLTLHSSDLAALMPENLDITLEGLKLDIIDPPEEAKEALQATGYNKIAASGALHTRWDKENKRLELQDLSFAAEDVGDFFLKFQIDNIDRLPLDADAQTRQQWLQKLRLHDFDMGVQDRGVLDKFAIIMADIGQVEPDEIRQMFEGIARGSPPILFEDEALASSATDFSNSQACCAST